MANMTSSFVGIGAPYQPCWQCGKQVSGHQADMYYGNFPFGIAHNGQCAERIGRILDRSLRALKALYNKDGDSLIYETVKRALINTSARKLGNSPLNKIQNDEVKRKVVETEGMQAALMTLRALSSMDDNTWQIQLGAHRRIMEGPEILKEEEQEPLSEKEKDAINEFKKCIRLDSADEEHREKVRYAVLNSILKQMESFVKEQKSHQNKIPYCIIENAFGPYYRNSKGISSIKELWQAIEKDGSWKVLFLAKECQDKARKKITQITIKHIAVLPSSVSLDDAKQAWQAKCNEPQGWGQPNVFLIECLEWQDHYVFLDEINQRISVGEGSEIRSSL